MRPQPFVEPPGQDAGRALGVQAHAAVAHMQGGFEGHGPIEHGANYVYINVYVKRDARFLDIAVFTPKEDAD